MFIILVVFGVNKLLINQLRNEAHEQVEFLAKPYSEAINSDNEEDITICRVSHTDQNATNLNAVSACCRID